MTEITASPEEPIPAGYLDDNGERIRRYWTEGAGAEAIVWPEYVPTTERKHMYEVRLVIEEEGRPLVDIGITTSRPKEGINAAALAADFAIKAHPDGPAVTDEPEEPRLRRPDLSGVRVYREPRDPGPTDGSAYVGGTP